MKGYALGFGLGLANDSKLWECGFKLYSWFEMREQ
jgi:hypothetical protein